ncbi:MAG TPA: 2-oxo-4-hydroxy-4-carboxy-5-ureidoimidazoline decarboxylase [Solirubrobacteraceae bacterium]|jgi:OHCU decarboxylase|nr:2-oxo-4-hydroxy-4-carboxy-5-ureidoimidazoline decarboxylase [Solirubrobacteraceae bacterium]
MADTRLAASGLAALGALAPGEAREAFLGCCASERWATEMVAGGPYGSPEALMARAEAAFATLTREEWLEAFAAHARLGAPRPDDERGASEQAGAASASAAERAALQDGNARYEAKFGHVFLIRARGLDAGAMLAALRERLANRPERELAIAAAQQREITRLRLEALLES